MTDYYHKIYFHLAFSRIEELIMSNGIYQSEITKDIKKHIDNCLSCIKIRKTNFTEPKIKQIILTFPNSRIQINLIDLNKKKIFRNKKRKC